MITEKINFNDSRVLIICPSTRWGTVERRALKDAQYLRDMGSLPVIFCLRDSSLDIRARQEMLECIYYQGTQLTRFVDLKYYLDITNILKKERFDLIHCYQLQYVWMLSLGMKKYSQSPLFLTLNHGFRSSYKNILAKWFLRRVDRVFCLSLPMKDIVPVFLAIHQRKVKYSGIGFEMKDKLADLESYEAEKKIIFTSIVNKENIDKIETLISMFLAFSKNQEAELYLHYNPLIEEEETIKKIKNIIIGVGAGEVVGLRKLDQEQNIFKLGQIFVSLFNDEILSDYEIMALASGSLVLAPRTIARSKEGAQFYGALQTYKAGDVSSLYRGMCSIADRRERLINQLIKHSEELHFHHGIDNYIELIINNFLNVMRARRRMAGK